MHRKDSVVVELRYYISILNCSIALHTSICPHALDTRSDVQHCSDCVSLLEVLTEGSIVLLWTFFTIKDSILCILGIAVGYSKLYDLWTGRVLICSTISPSCVSWGSKCPSLWVIPECVRELGKTNRAQDQP
jgi:hypothetical protein